MSGFEQRSAWVSNVWGTGDQAAHEKRRLKQGEEPCPICLTDPVEVKFKPCNHDVCLECCNRMRAANVFKADAGIKCGMCRQYIELYTDLDGNPSSVPSLLKANQAAAKSKAGRQAGTQQAVSTSVPDPMRLVPPVTGVRAEPPGAGRGAGRAEPTWYCDKCRHVNTGTKEACNRCGSLNPGFVKPNTSKDPLNCVPEEILRSAKERNHPQLNKALSDAGMPWAQGKVGGTVESMKKALRTRGHERLMRIVKVVCEGHNMEEVALDLQGNYAVQSLLDACHKLRNVAHMMVQQGHPPLEHFSSVSGVTAATAFTLLLRALAPLMGQLVNDGHGVHVMVTLSKMASPSEVVQLAQQMVPEFLGYLMQGQAVGMLFVTHMVDRLCKIRQEGGQQTQQAAGLLAALCAQFCANQKTLMWCARNQYGGAMVVHALEMALPAADAFKVGWSIATSSASLSCHKNGVRTLELLCSLKPADGRCSEMIRDLACYAAKSLQGSFAELALRREEGGERLVRAMLTQLQAHREDYWVEWIISELVAAGDKLVHDRDASDLLQFALSMPTLTHDLLNQHLRRLHDSMGQRHFNPLEQQVRANRNAPSKLPRKLHAAPSEVSPYAPHDVTKKFPIYLRDGAHAHPQHSMLRKEHPPPPPPRAHPGSPVRAPSSSAAGPSALPPNGSLANGGLVNGTSGQAALSPAKHAEHASSAQHSMSGQASAASSRPGSAASAAPAPHQAHGPPPGFVAPPRPPAGPPPLAQPTQQQASAAARAPPGFTPPASALLPAQPMQPAVGMHAPPTPPPQLHAPAVQAPSPPGLADPSMFFPRPAGAAPASAQPPPPRPPLQPAQPQQQAPSQQAQQLAPPPPMRPLQPQAPPAAPAAAPPAGFGGFLSLPEMLAQLTMGAEAAAPAAAAQPAPAAPVAPPPPLMPPAPQPQCPAAPRPGGSYRPVGLNPSAAAAGQQPQPRPALNPAATSFAQPAAAGGAYGYGAAAPAPAVVRPPALSAAAPAFSYMTTQAALPQQPAALFHPTALTAQPQPQQRAAPPPMPHPQQPPQQQQRAYPQQQPAQQQNPYMGAYAAAQQAARPSQPPPPPQARAAAPAATRNAAAAPAPIAGPSWACKVCTYEHTGREAQYLACALCGAPQAS